MELKENTVIVVLGASGDLAKKKTVSSLNQPIGLHETMLTNPAVPCSLRPGKLTSSASSCRVLTDSNV